MSNKSSVLATNKDAFSNTQNYVHAHNATELTDVRYICLGVYFCIEQTGVPSLFGKLGRVAFLFCHSSAYLAFQALKAPSFSSCPTISCTSQLPCLGLVDV